MGGKSIKGAHYDQDAKLFFQFPSKGFLRMFPEINLASGELPLVGFEPGIREPLSD